MLRLAQYCDNSFGLEDVRRSGAEIAPQRTRLHLKARALFALGRALGTPHEIPHPPAPQYTQERRVPGTPPRYCARFPRDPGS